MNQKFLLPKCPSCGTLISDTQQDRIHADMDEEARENRVHGMVIGALGALSAYVVFRALAWLIFGA